MFPIMELQYDSPPKVMWGCRRSDSETFPEAKTAAEQLPGSSIESQDKFETFAAGFEATMIFKEGILSFS